MPKTKFLALGLLAVTLAAGCSRADRTPVAEAEYHLDRYERLCDHGNDGSPPCLAYGEALNELETAQGKAAVAQALEKVKEAAANVPG